MKKKLLAWWMALCMAIQCGGALAGDPVAADTETGVQASMGQTISESMIWINPLYADTVTEAELVAAVREKSVQAEHAPVYSASISALGEQVRNKLVAREPVITVYYQGKTHDNTIMKRIFTEAVRHTGVPNEGDYLCWQYAGWQGSMSGYEEEETYYLTLTYTLTYYTTAKQEAEVDTAVSDIRKQLNVEGKSDYETVCSIYDYICQNVTYDEEHLPDDSYKRKYTAYAAIFDHTAVCQGYALLFYRLAMEEGIDCRFISGTGNGVDHGWNIVKLGSYYYNVDSTWDSEKTPYQYFLRCDTGFPGHIRDADYTSETFQKAYPMDTVDYAERLKEHSHSYGQPVFSWSDNLSACTAEWSCSLGDAVIYKGCTVTQEKTREPDCTQNGKITYTASTELDSTPYTDTKIITTAALGHACGQPQFQWSDNLSSCTAEFLCSRCGATVTERCTVSATTIPASCLQDGSVTAQAQAVMNGIVYTDQKTNVLPATGHTYQQPEFRWSEDNTACTAVFTCAGGDDTQKVPCTVTSMTTLPTCTDEGKLLYAATAEFGGKSYIGEEKMIIPALGHTWSEPVFQWSEDLKACTAAFTCDTCGEAATADCTITSDRNGKTAVCTWDGKHYTDYIEHKLTQVEDIFTDVSAKAWYRKYVQQVFDRGIMSGTSETTFAPDEPITRAQIVQMLYNYEKKPEVTGKMPFSDIKTKRWYYHAVLWASQNNIVAGMPDGTFQPEKDISRQQLAVILYNHAGRPEVSGSLHSIFADSKSIGGWASDAVLWAYQNGIVSGIKSGNTLRFEPNGNATRAQAATMISLYLK